MMVAGFGPLNFGVVADALPRDDQNIGGPAKIHIIAAEQKKTKEMTNMKELMFFPESVKKCLAKEVSKIGGQQILDVSVKRITAPITFDDDGYVDGRIPSAKHTVNFVSSDGDDVVLTLLEYSYESDDRVQFTLLKATKSGDTIYEINYDESKDCGQWDDLIDQASALLGEGKTDEDVESLAHCSDIRIAASIAAYVVDFGLDGS